LSIREPQSRGNTAITTVGAIEEFYALCKILTLFFLAIRAPQTVARRNCHLRMTTAVTNYFQAALPFFNEKYPKPGTMTLSWFRI